MSKVRFGIDLGGTKTGIIALDENGDECLRRRVPTPQGDYPAILKTVTELIRQAEDELACHASVGIGMPGALSPASGVIVGTGTGGGIVVDGKLLTAWRVRWPVSLT